LPYWLILQRVQLGCGDTGGGGAYTPLGVGVCTPAAFKSMLQALLGKTALTLEACMIFPIRIIEGFMPFTCQPNPICPLLEEIQVLIAFSLTREVPVSCILQFAGGQETM
jgi:hypothetical protein